MTRRELAAPPCTLVAVTTATATARATASIHVGATPRARQDSSSELGAQARATEMNTVTRAGKFLRRKSRPISRSTTAISTFGGAVIVKSAVTAIRTAIAVDDKRIAELHPVTSHALEIRAPDLAPEEMTGLITPTIPWIALPRSV